MNLYDIALIILSSLIFPAFSYNSRTLSFHSDALPTQLSNKLFKNTHIVVVIVVDTQMYYYIDY